MRKSSKLKDVQKAYDELQQATVVDKERPRTWKDFEIPEFPKNLTVCSSKKLGRLYTIYTQQIVYLNELVTEAKLKLLEQIFARRRRKAICVVHCRGIKIEKESAPYQDQEYRNLCMKCLNLKHQLAAFMNIVWGCRDYLRAIEVEHERRKAERYYQRSD